MDLLSDLPLKNHHANQHTVLENIDTQIQILETQIADLTNHKQVLEQAKDHILHRTNSSEFDSPLQRARPYLTPRASASRTSSSLRQQALVRSALGRDDSPSPSATSGLLASDGFKAGFGEYVEVVASVEDSDVLLPGRVRSTSSAASSSSAGSAATLGKRAKKRKLQENAANAREARRMKMEGDAEAS
jgi:hypothetical protein